MTTEQEHRSKITIKQLVNIPDLEINIDFFMKEDKNLNLEQRSNTNKTSN